MMRKTAMWPLAGLMMLLAAAVEAWAAPGDAATEKPAAGKAKAAAAVPDYGLPQVARINQEISQVWKDNNIAPSPPATDGEWCRRVFLDVLGRVPSVQELREFVNSKERLYRGLRPQLDLDLDEHSDWPQRRAGRSFAHQPSGHAKVPAGFVRPQQDL
jgi:hypothetical protein